MEQHTAQTLKTVADGGAFVSAVGLLAGVVPLVVGALTAVWTAMRITEMITGKPFSETRFAEVVRCLWRRVFPKREG
jgi:hypothetical protein